MALARLPRLKCVKWSRLLPVLALTMLLGACSSVGLAYRQADTLAWWWLDRRLDFDDAQAPRVRQALTQWLDWHRRHPLALAEDVALIEEIAREAGADTRPERLCRWWQQLRERQQLHLQTLAGGAMARHAKNRVAAVKFLEYLATDEAQRYFADGNNEWPAVASLKVDNPALAQLGKFKADTLPVGALAMYRAKAQMIYDRAGFR